MTESEIKRGRIMLIIGGMMITLTQTSISGNCFPIFVIPVSESLGFARGVFSWCQSFVALGAVAGALFSAYVYERWGIVRVMRMGGMLAVALYLLQSFASSIPVFFAINLIIGICNGVSTSLPLSLLVGERFTEKRSTVIGIIMMGSGFGSSTFSKIGTNLIIDLGWRSAMRVLGFIMLGFSLISYFVLVRDTGNAGRRLSGAVETGGPIEEPPEPFFRGRRPAVAVMCFFMSVSACTFINTTNPYIQDIGYSQSFAASVYAAGMLSMAFGKILHGLIIDKWGVRISNAILIGTALIGLYGLLNFRSVWYSVPVCIGMLFIYSLGVVGMPAITEAMVGQKNKKYYLGKFTSFVSTGYAVTPFIYGAIYDRTGSYVPMYYAAAIIFALCLIGVFTLLPSRSESLLGK
ncbi:MAG: MFS transporter [Firmicutes bacterium]|nr:MFS transporter [Bacillota bacterium]